MVTPTHVTQNSRFVAGKLPNILCIYRPKRRAQGVLATAQLCDLRKELSNGDKYVHKLCSAEESAAHLPLLMSDTFDTLYPIHLVCLQPSGQCLHAAHDSHI